MKHYDVIVIGSGQAGTTLAKKMALAGKKTALIEKKWIGGTCVNVGCTPTKAMVASARLAYLAARQSDLGVNIGGFTVDMAQIKKRKDGIVLSFRNGSQKGLEATPNLDLLFGEAAFSAHKTVVVTMNDGSESTLTAGWFFINTGGKTIIPDIEGINEVDYLSSSSILDLEEVPDHLLVIGANYIGMEFGQMFRRFGSKVTMLDRGTRVLTREDEDVAACIKKILEDEGIEILTGSQTQKLKQTAPGHIVAKVNTDGKLHDIKCSHVLVAVGRAPQTEALKLQNTGVATDKHGAITVNNKLETNVPGIYALGDVNGGPAFTHIAYNDYTIVYRNLMEGTDYTTDDRPVPYCMFTDPQLGRIGITEDEAKKRGLNYKVATLPMTRVARAIETGETRGLMKAVVDPLSKKILGAAIVGVEGGEIMSVLEMAMEGGITYDRIRYCVFAHPTYSESLNNLFMSIAD